MRLGNLDSQPLLQLQHEVEEVDGIELELVAKVPGGVQGIGIDFGDDLPQCGHDLGMDADSVHARPFKDWDPAWKRRPRERPAFAPAARAASPCPSASWAACPET